MARKRKPCWWCESEKFIQLVDTDKIKNVDACLEIYPDNEFMGIDIDGMSDDGELTFSDDRYEIPMHYCPNCGRKLGY